MDTSVKIEAKVKRLTDGEYFVEDLKNGMLLAKVWREDVANQIAASLNGKDLDLLNGKAGEILIAQLDELATIRAERDNLAAANAELREALIKAESALTYANWDGAFDDNHTAQDVINARDTARAVLAKGAK